MFKGVFVWIIKIYSKYLFSYLLQVSIIQKGFILTTSHTLATGATDLAAGIARESP